MANILRIRRRTTGQTGAPSSLYKAELAYNEPGNVLYYGFGDNGSGQATSIVPIAGTGAFLGLASNSTITGNNTFSGTTTLNGTITGTGISTYVTAFRLDQFATPNTNLALGSNRITGLADPVNPNDAANKAYVDAARSGLDAKESVRAATLSNITLSGLSTIDGVSLSQGDRVLVKNQTSGADNGIYTAASGSWIRATDADVSSEVTSGLFVFVEEGTTNAGRGYVLTTNNPITLGTTALAFTQFSDSGSITAGTALSFSSTTLNVQTDGSTISVNGLNQLRVHTSYVGQSSITTLGTITTGVWNATAIPLGYGGTGGDLSGASNGSIFKKSGTTLVAATAGTDYLNDSSAIDGGSF